MFAPLMASSPIFALSFVGFGFGKKIQQSHPDEVRIILDLLTFGDNFDQGEQHLLWEGKWNISANDQQKRNLKNNFWNLRAFIKIPHCIDIFPVFKIHSFSTNAMGGKRTP